MLTTDELKLYRRQGWVILPDFAAADLEPILDDLMQIFPSPEAYWADPTLYPELQGGQFDSVRTIPTGVPRLDRLPFHRLVRDIAEQVTESSDLRLMRGGYQSKFSGAADFDQILHLDYTNHTLVVLQDADVSTMVGFLAVEGHQVKGVLLTISPSSFMAARLLLRDAGVKVERPERSEDERP